MADEVDLAARNADPRTVAAARRHMDIARAIATTSSELAPPVLLPVGAIPAAVTATPAALIEILMPAFCLSCPLARRLRLAGCDGCQHCRDQIGFNIRLCNLGIRPLRNFAVTITKNVLIEKSDGQFVRSAERDSDAINLEIDACHYKLNVEPPGEERRPLLAVAVPCTPPLDEMQMISGPDDALLYVFTGRRWVLRDEWMLICGETESVRMQLKKY